MPTGQNPVQLTTKATKYYISLSLSFLLLLSPRERLVASPVYIWLSQYGRGSLSCVLAGSVEGLNQGAPSALPGLNAHMPQIRGEKFEEAFTVGREQPTLISSLYWILVWGLDLLIGLMF